MTSENERWRNDLRVASGFVKAIRTGRADLDLELQELAACIDRLAARQREAPRAPAEDRDGRDAA